MIKETNATTGNITDYLYGDDLIKQSKAANDRYYLYDGLGSTRALTDSTGTITDTYNYESFGTVLNQTRSTSNDYLFTGEQYDSGLDNYYLRARYYDQNIGRFTQQDTWMGNNSDPITLHKYLYANADPVNMIDPSGNFSLVSFGVANNIRSILSDITVDVGFSLFDSAFSDDANAGPNVIGAGLGVIGGPASFKLLKMLSSKFRKACNSFDADTEVWTEDGIKIISGLEIGEKVWAYNEETDELELQDIVHLIQREGEYLLIELTIGNDRVDSTDSHPFYVKTQGSWEWENAGELKVGDIVKDQQGNEKTVAAVNTKSHSGKVYNLTVDNVHTYLVGKQGVVAHNMGKTCRLPEIEVDFTSLNSARKHAKNSARLGNNAIPFVQEIGPYANKVVTGMKSPDGLRGWRLDWDSRGSKGFHVNWWVEEEGILKRGANKIEGATYDDFLKTIEHFPKL